MRLIIRLPPNGLFFFVAFIIGMVIRFGFFDMGFTVRMFISGLAGLAF
jgi:hypothetical protein